MTLTTGTRLGPYEILSAAGAGGMGEVYKATDTRLRRTVAIKILPPHVAGDPDLKQRFEREARAISGFNHPNICTLYDVGSQEGIEFLVMEYLEGETLAERLTRGALPLDLVLRYAIEISSALDRAHRQGIVHRDLKPGNIMLTKGGAKLLDFGLAKMLPEGAAVSGPGLAAAITGPGTMEGTILGTLHYMSPEQVEGRDTDARTDIFAFGSLIYEMATGKKAFEGKTAASVIGAILEREPAPMSALRPLTPRALDHVVSRCLAKDRDERWQTAADLMRELKWIAEPGSQPKENGTRGVAREERLAWIAILGVVIFFAGLVGFLYRRPAPPAPEMRVDIATPPTSDPVSLAISPDGRKVVFAASSGGEPRLWLRALDSASAVPLAGTDRGRAPFWSPDGRSLAFFADGQFRRLDLATGSVAEFAGAAFSLGGTWNRDNVILFGMGANQPIHRVTGDTGAPAAITRVEVNQIGHRTPRFLPDGRHFLYQALGSAESRGIYVGALDGSAPRRLLDVESPAVYSSGRLLYLRENTLLAQPFDPDRLTLSGDPVQVAEHVARDGAAAAFSASLDGTIVYREGGRSSGFAGVRQLVRVDRSGRELEKVTSPDFANAPAPSPDDRYVALQRVVDGNTDVWLLDTARRTFTRLTTDVRVDAFPVWSPDGKRIAFQSYAAGNGDLYVKDASGAAPGQLIVSSGEAKHPMDWSRDGRYLLYRSLTAKAQYDLWAVPLAGERKPFPVVQTAFDERNAQFSPDGKWIAYESNETGRYEVYIRPFPGTAAAVPISTSGGAQARWRGDGRELFFIALDGALMTVPIQLGAGSPEIGNAVRLFATHIGGALQQSVTRQQYAVSADGRRFLMNTLVEDANVAPISVILNWKGGKK